jgi:hypothetical protein
MTYGLFVKKYNSAKAIHERPRKEDELHVGYSNFLARIIDGHRLLMNASAVNPIFFAI